MSLHFLDAPTAVRSFVVVMSFSLSSVFCCSCFFFLLFLMPPAVLGVDPEPLSRKDTKIGVRACDPGVDPGMPDSYIITS